MQEQQDLGQAAKQTTAELRAAAADIFTLKRLYSVFDAKASTFTAPFDSATDETAVRQIAGSVRRSDHPFCEHAEDFTLWYLGDLVVETGELLPATPALVTSMTSVKATLESRE